MKKALGGALTIVGIIALMLAAMSTKTVGDFVGFGVVATVVFAGAAVIGWKSRTRP